MARRLRDAPAALAPAASLLVLAVAAAGFGPSSWWLCDLLANCRLHALAAAVLLLPLQIRYGRRRLAALTALTIAAIAFSILARPSANGAADAAPGESLTILSYNLRKRTANGAAVLDLLERTPADIVILQEYSPTWHASLGKLAARYPHAVTVPRDDYFGIALYSARPLANVAVRRFEESGIPFITADVALGGRDVTVAGVHFEWPVLPSTFAVRNRQLEGILQLAAGAAKPLIVCGDMNLTPWSGHFRRLLDSGLHDGSLADRIEATWPAALGFLGIPIDHCLASAPLRLYDKSTLASPGSDHRPIVSRIAFAAE